MRLKNLKESLVKEFLNMICRVLLLLFWSIGFGNSFAVLFLVLGVELRTSHIPGKFPTTELCPRSQRDKYSRGESYISPHNNILEKNYPGNICYGISEIFLQSFL